MAAAGIGAGSGVPLTAWPAGTWSMSHAQPVEIRRADLADAGQVGVLTEQVYRRGGWADEDYSKLLLDGRSRIEDATVLVAVADGVIVGTVTLARAGGRFANVGRAGEAEVRMLAVDEPAAAGAWRTGLWRPSKLWPKTRAPPPWCYRRSPTCTPRSACTGAEAMSGSPTETGRREAPF